MASLHVSNSTDTTLERNAHQQDDLSAPCRSCSNWHGQSIAEQLNVQASRSCARRVPSNPQVNLLPPLTQTSKRFLTAAVQRTEPEPTVKRHVARCDALSKSCCDQGMQNGQCPSSGILCPPVYARLDEANVRPRSTVRHSVQTNTVYVPAVAAPIWRLTAEFALATCRRANFSGSCGLTAPPLLVQSTAFCTERGSNAKVNQVRTLHWQLCSPTCDASRGIFRASCQTEAYCLSSVCVISNIDNLRVCIDIQHMLQAAPAYRLPTQYICRMHPYASQLI